MGSVSAVVPVLDEAAAIGDVVRALLASGATEVIVVDGGSRDGTVEAASAAGAQVIVERRRGYGHACATGAHAASGDVIAFIDGDGADDPASLPLLIGPVSCGQADMVLGARSRMETGALPPHAVLGNRIAAAIISLLWRQHITDLPSFKALRREHLAALNMTEATYGWTIEMIVKAARRGYRLVEVPLTYRRRTGGESKVSGNVRASARAACSMLTTLARHGLAPL